MFDYLKFAFAKEILILTTNVDPSKMIVFARLNIKEGFVSTMLSFQQAVPRLEDTGTKR